MDQLHDYVMSKRADFEEQKVCATNDSKEQFAAWERYSSKYGSRLLSKWGYAGGGLGRDGNGIVSPIKVETAIQTTNNTWPRNTILIIGDSMLNGIEEERLRRYNVKVEAFPGSTIKDMYGFVSPFLCKKPSMIIIHVGTNDTPHKPSDIIVQCYEHEEQNS